MDYPPFTLLNDASTGLLHTCPNHLWRDSYIFSTVVTLNFSVIILFWNWSPILIGVTADPIFLSERIGRISNEWLVELKSPKPSFLFISTYVEKSRTSCQWLLCLTSGGRTHILLAISHQFNLIEPAQEGRISKSTRVHGGDSPCPS